MLSDIPIMLCLFADDSLFFLQSWDSFSARMPQMFLKKSISEIFNIPDMDKPGKYLGLPSDWGRSKK